MASVVYRMKQDFNEDICLEAKSRKDTEQGGMLWK